MKGFTYQCFNQPFEMRAERIKEFFERFDFVPTLDFWRIFAYFLMNFLWLDVMLWECCHGTLTQGGSMPKKSRKSVSFDAMVKFFMQNYNIPTKSDVEKLITRMDRLEELIKAMAFSGRRTRIARANSAKTGTANGGSVKTASDSVLEVIKASKDGIDFADIRRRIGYEDKKLRNIIFRLNKTDKIRRIRRGIYIAI